jgi:hypothetical protein
MGGTSSLPTLNAPPGGIGSANDGGTAGEKKTAYSQNMDTSSL